jgi:hypothetical protein
MFVIKYAGVELNVIFFGFGVWGFSVPWEISKRSPDLPPNFVVAFRREAKIL